MLVSNYARLPNQGTPEGLLNTQCGTRLPGNVLLVLQAYCDLQREVLDRCLASLPNQAIAGEELPKMSWSHVEKKVNGYASPAIALLAYKSAQACLQDLGVCLLWLSATAGDNLALASSEAQMKTDARQQVMAKVNNMHSLHVEYNDCRPSCCDCRVCRS